MLYLMSAITALLLTLIGSLWIDRLYAMPNIPLQFPDRLRQRARFRKPILVVALFVLIYHFLQIPAPQCFYLIAVSFFLLLITITDFEQYIIFDRMLIPFILIGCAAVIHLELPLNMHMGALLVGGGMFLMLASIFRNALGGGDVKLIAALGLWLGPQKLSIVLISGLILGGVAALAVLLTKGNRVYLPYGPYFTLTAIYILFTSSSLK